MSRGAEGTALSAPSRVEVMGDMGAFSDRVLSEIGRARRRVDIECFIVRADRLGGELARALAAAAARGVRCRLLYDPLSVGLAYTIGQILGPLRDARAVFRALVANFVLVPLLAVGIVRIFPMDPPLALGLFLLAGSAGAPFLIKLASAAKSDLALSAGLLVLLVPATVVFLPFYVPLAMAHPSLRGVSYAPSNVLKLGVPLLSTLVLPLLVGGVVKLIAPRWAARPVPIGGKVSTVAVVLVMVSTSAPTFRR